MNRKRLGLCVLAVGAVVLAPSLARAACTATFTADGSGTFGDTFEYDRRTKVLTVDLSGIPAGARIFRAELILNGPRRFAEAPITPTTVYPAGQPEKKLSFVAPRFVSLDALEAVAAAVAAKQPLKLKLEVTLAGAKRLGMYAALVLSGKYREASVVASIPEAERPDLTVARVGDLLASDQFEF